MGNRSSRTRNRSSRTLKGHSDYVRSVSFSPDGASIVSGSRDNTVKVWSVESGECVTTFEGHSLECVFRVVFPGWCVDCVWFGR